MNYKCSEYFSDKDNIKIMEDIEPNEESFKIKNNNKFNNFKIKDDIKKEVK